MVKLQNINITGSVKVMVLLYQAKCKSAQTSWYPWQTKRSCEL